MKIQASATVPPASQGQLHLFDTALVSSPAAAPYTAGGFYYQLPYATLEALNLSQGEALGIEVFDDVHLSGPDGTKLTQIKNETTPVTDLNRGLWNALFNWANLIRSSPRNDITKMIFVTTAPIREGLPSLLARETKAEERLIYVQKNIRGSKDEALDAQIKSVTSLPLGILASLLARVRLVQEVGAPELFDKIRIRLRYHFTDEELDEGANEFVGWLVQRVTEATAQKNGAYIPESMVRDVLHSMRNRRRPHRQRYRYSNAPINPDERVTHKTSTFLRQLDAIGASDSLCNMALEDYLRQTKEEIEWARNLEVGKQELVEYQEQIREKWRVLSEDIPGYWRNLDDESYGLVLCDAMLKAVSPRLFVDDSPPAHVFRGSCHKLANVPRIGWHRKWEQLFIPYDPNKG